MTKGEIDSKVAGVLGLPISQVSLITTTFLRFSALMIARHGILYLVGFGTFKLSGKLTDEIRFKKTHVFRRLIKENPMEKLGVDEGVDQEKSEKAAAQGCPACGAKVEKVGSLLVCPRCGTAPFERKSP